jgi:hypothetical protein
MWSTEILFGAALLSLCAALLSRCTALLLFVRAANLGDRRRDPSCISTVRVWRYRLQPFERALLVLLFSVKGERCEKNKKMSHEMASGKAPARE